MKTTATLLFPWFLVFSQTHWFWELYNIIWTLFFWMSVQRTTKITSQTHQSLPVVPRFAELLGEITQNPSKVSTIVIHSLLTRWPLQLTGTWYLRGHEHISNSRFEFWMPHMEWMCILKIGNFRKHDAAANSACRVQNLLLCMIKSE